MGVKAGLSRDYMYVSKFSLHQLPEIRGHSQRYIWESHRGII